MNENYPYKLRLRAFAVMPNVSVKPHPQIGNVWQYSGEPAFEGTVVGTRIFYGECQAIFNDGLTAASISHMLRDDAWQYVHTIDPVAHYRDIFKTAYTRAVMRGAEPRAGVYAGAQAVRKAIGDDDRAAEVMQTLRARLGDVLGVAQ